MTLNSTFKKYDIVSMKNVEEHEKRNKKTALKNRICLHNNTNERTDEQ